MGTFRVEIAVGDVERRHFEPIQALVDTGATYTVLPRCSSRSSASFRTDGRASFSLTDGTSSGASVVPGSGSEREKSFRSSSSEKMRCSGL